MVFNFFKRCYIIADILVNIKKLSPSDTREQIFNETLASDLKYFFKTIDLCIQMSEENQNINELLELNDFQPIVDHILTVLNRAFYDHDLQAVGKEYEKTLKNVLLRFAVAQRDEEDFVTISANDQIGRNNPASLLYKVKKALI